MTLPDFLTPYKNELEPFKRDYVHVESTAVDPDHNCDDYHINRALLNIRASKFLGKPYWPQTMEYPKRSSDGRPMILAVQINFAEVPPLGDFPRSGLLQLFVCAGEGDYVRWKYDGNYRIIFHDKIDADALNDFSFLTSDLFSESPIGTEAALSFEKRIEYGGIHDMCFTFSETHDPDDGKFDYDLFEAFLDGFTATQQSIIEELLGGRGEKIGGYAEFTQVDPRNNGDILILQVDGFREAFHAGTGHIFIPAEALRNRDFSKAYLHHDNT